MMPIRTFELSTELDQFVLMQIASGRYQDVGEVIQAALHELDREQKLKQQDEEKMAALVDAIAEGDASGIYEGDPFEDIRKELDLPARVRA